MFRYILIPEGSSDRALVPLINWCIRQHYSKDLIPDVADFSSIRPKPRTVADKLKAAHQLYPGVDLFIVHRDSDNVEPKVREGEISQAISGLKKCRPSLPIIPTTMMEAWLLADERAIYKAANNPNGRDRFTLPQIDMIEKIRDPKACLYELLAKASGLSMRRRRSIDFFECRQRCAKCITEFSKLERLTSFKRFHARIKKVLDEVR